MSGQRASTFSEAAEPSFQIIETNGDARQVADSVAIRVGEAAWVDLVEDRRSPPSGGTLSQQGASLSGDAATSL